MGWVTEQRFSGVRTAETVWICPLCAGNELALRRYMEGPCESYGRPKREHVCGCGRPVKEHSLFELFMLSFRDVAGHIVTDWEGILAIASDALFPVALLWYVGALSRKNLVVWLVFSVLRNAIGLSGAALKRAIQIKQRHQ